MRIVIPPLICSPWCGDTQAIALFNSTWVKASARFRWLEGCPGLHARTLARDPILHTPLLSAVRSQCYTDDFEVYAYASSPGRLIEAMNTALACIAKWLTDHHLEAAAHKSEGLGVSRRRNVKNISPILLQGESTVPSSSLRYLGIHLDHGLTFRTHNE